MTNRIAKYGIVGQSKEVSLTIVVLNGWYFVGTTHCASLRTLRMCYNSLCDQSTTKAEAYLVDGQVLTIGDSWFSYVATLVLGDLMLTTNKCMSPSDFALRQAGKMDIPTCLPGNNGFYDTCGVYGLIVKPVFSGDSDLGNNLQADISSNIDYFQTTYGVTIIGQKFYISGWYKYTTLGGTMGLLMTLDKKTGTEWINLEGQYVSGTGQISLRVSWEFTLIYGVSGQATANCGGLPSSGFVYVYLQIEESAGSTNFIVCCHDETQCSTGTAAVTGPWTTYLPEDSIHFYHNSYPNSNPYSVYYLKVVPYSVSFTPTAAFFTGIKADPPMTAVDVNCGFGNGPVCSTCPTGMYVSGNNCKPCHPNCLTCTAPGPHRCSQCKSPSFSQPSHPSLCLPTCPSGFTPVGQSCTQSDTGFLMDVDFTTHTGSTFTVSNNRKVSFKTLMPWGGFVTPGRGLFLNYSSIVQLPNYDSDPGVLILNCDFSFDVWLLPYSPPVLFSASAESGVSIFGFGANGGSFLNDAKLAIIMTNFRRNSVLLESNLPTPPTSEWVHLGFSVSYDAAADASTVYIVKNLQVAAGLVFQSFFRETGTVAHQVGMGNGMSWQMKGVINSFRIANYVRTLVDFGGDMGICRGCSACPARENACLSLCRPTEYITPTQSCAPCAYTCEFGCSSSSFCSYCPDPICSDCNTITGVCARCFPGADLINGKCVCSIGYVLLAGSCAKACGEGYYVRDGVCRECQGGCRACEDGNVCNECVAKFLLIGGRCSCGPKWFIAASWGCEQCDPSCSACEHSSDRCTECPTEDGYYLSNNHCLDCRAVPGYDAGLGITSMELKEMNKVPTVETVCRETCGDGVMKGQYECDDGNTVDGDGCSSACRVENGWSCAHPSTGPSVCRDLTLPGPILKYRNKTSFGCILLLSFNETVTPLDGFESRIRVKVGYYDLFSVSLTPVSPTEDHSAFSTYELDLTFFQVVSANTEVTVTVPSDLTDLSGNHLAVAEASDRILDPFLISTTEYVTLATSIYSGGLVSLSLLSFAVSVLIEVRFDSFWTMVEQVQVVNVLLYSSVKMPDNLRYFLKGLNFVNLGVVPNVMRWSVDEDYDKADGAFAREDVGVGFLFNFGGALTIWLFLILLSILAAILTYLFPELKSIPSIQRLFPYSLFLRFAIESYFQTALSVALQLSDPRPSDTLDPFNLIGTVFGALLLILLPVIIFVKVTSKASSKLKSEEHMQKFGSLYDCYKTSRRSKRSFLAVRLLRRLLFIVLLVGLSGRGVAQASLLVVVTMGYMGGLVTIWPFRARWLGNFGAVAETGLLLLAQGVMVIIAVEGYGISTRNSLGWIAISLFTSHLTLSLILLLTDSALQTTQQLTKMYHSYAAEIVESAKLREADKAPHDLDTTVIPTEIDESQKQQETIKRVKVLPRLAPVGQKTVRRRVEVGPQRRKK